VGLILTPIYLLSMLRQVFYGKARAELKLEGFFNDANPRELFITACLLLPIIGIGLYPKLATETYDVKTVEVALKARAELPAIAESQPPLQVPPLTASALMAPQLPGIGE
ncbi:MAG: NAD(P)H-quinone oxidoreductase subunit 4, partial [Cyanobacteriota bacterium]|nr:NAD(P)H-quinone oxidoreductase subunit 4 [Cyanobacteriota bacterium]